MAIDIREGNLPHIFWIDLDNKGTLTECAVMKRDGNGNIYYFPVNALDQIDRRRLLRILRNRNAQNFELWDLMSNITLNNGVNALTYFHQLVQILTPSGVKTSPRAGEMGVSRAGTHTGPVVKETEEAKEAVTEGADAQPAAQPASKKKASSKKKSSKQ